MVNILPLGQIQRKDNNGSSKTVPSSVRLKAYQHRFVEDNPVNLSEICRTAVDVVIELWDDQDFEKHLRERMEATK